MRKEFASFTGLLAVFLFVLMVLPTFAQEDMAAKNKEIARKLVEEGIVKGDLSVIDKYVAEDAVNHSAPPDMPKGREGIKQLFKMLRNAFPDYQVSFDDEIAEGDKVVQRVTVTGTMKGEFMGMAPTGKKGSWMEIHIVRFKEGKIVEHWGLIDQHAMMQQLGLTPAMGEETETKK